MAKHRHTIIIERRTKENDDEPSEVTVLATIDHLGPIWMPTCLFPMCAKSGIALCEERLVQALANTVAHLEDEHGEHITR
jgi:hypothetical protein